MSAPRFEVRECDPSQSDNPLVRNLVRNLVAADDRYRILYRVWDLAADRTVPFGQYRDRARAEARVLREEEKATAAAVQDEKEDH